MPFAYSVSDVRLVQSLACRVVPKWSPGCCLLAGAVGLLTSGIFMGGITRGTWRWPALAGTRVYAPSPDHMDCGVRNGEAFAGADQHQTEQALNSVSSSDL